MTRRPSATVTVRRLSGLHQDAVRVEISCPAGTTGLAHVPGGAFEMEAPAPITVAAFAHAERCDGDTSAAHAEGDPRVNAEAELLAAAVQQRRQAAYAEEARN